MINLCINNIKLNYMKKKFTLIVLAFVSFMGISMQAQTVLSPTTSKEVYDLKNFNDKKMLDFFYDAIKASKMFPDETDLICPRKLDNKLSGFYYEHKETKT